MKYKKGFTLIELLAVILILGIIALIAIPTVAKMVEEAKLGAFKSSVENILKVGEQKYYMEVIKNNTTKNIYNLEDKELDYKGDTSIVGYVGIKDDKSAIAVNDGKYCGKKDLNDKEITITDYNGFCEIDPELLVKDVDPSCFTFDDITGTITKYNSECGDSIRIPEKINGVTVTKIGNSAFVSTKITVCYNNPTYSFTYPNGSKELLESDDLDCYDNTDCGLLRYVEFPNTITYIGDDAFYLNRIEKLYLPDSLTSMGTWSFAQNHIKELHLPNNLQNMGSCVFERNQLTSVNIPGSLKIIPDHAFGCNYIKNITLNEGIEKVESNAFWNHYTNEIIIPSSMKRLDYHAFHWGKTHKVIIKNKNSSDDFDYYYNEQNSIFGWDNGYDDSYIIYEGKDL